MERNRIYIAAQDKVLQKGLFSVLQKHGFDVRIFDSGYPLVEMMDNWPDAFLIDIELPGINGLEVCKWLKSHESSRHIPVIFLSGDPYLKIIAASSHADDYIGKPVSYSKLIKRIKENLHSAVIGEDDQLLVEPLSLNNGIM